MAGSVDVGAILGQDGRIAQRLQNYESRPEQLQMAQAVADAIAQRRHLIVEAGTGVGKSFAYLVPALLSGGKVIISTGTKNLQDQLDRNKTKAKDKTAAADSRPNLTHRAARVRKPGASRAKEPFDDPRRPDRRRRLHPHRRRARPGHLEPALRPPPQFP